MPCKLDRKQPEVYRDGSLVSATGPAPTVSATSPALVSVNIFLISAATVTPVDPHTANG